MHYTKVAGIVAAFVSIASATPFDTFGAIKMRQVIPPTCPSHCPDTAGCKSLFSFDIFPQQCS